MFKVFAVLAVAVSCLLVAPAQQAAAHSGGGVVSCATVKRGQVHITTVVWPSGATSTRRNLSARTKLFPGVREMWEMKDRPKDPTIVHCRVQYDGTVVVRTKSRAQYAYVIPVAAVIETAPSPAAPSLLGVWDRPVVLYSTVDASWGVETAASAWNAGLPADRQITVTRTDCSDRLDVACVPVEVFDFTGYSEGGEGLGGGAWQGYSAGQMLSCRIGLNEVDVVLAGRPQITVHEVGHCLGLPHWTTEGSGVWTTMSSRNAAATVTSWDLAWISAAY